MSFLTELVAGAHMRAAELKQQVTPETLEQRLASVAEPRSLEAALRGPEVAIIAEVKRASPVAGLLDLELNAAATARAYADGGAAAVSVLTEPEHFRGTLTDLEQARAANLPLLRKDFIVDEYQVMESRAAGADSVLIVVRVLDDELGSLVAACRALDMDPLVEVHDQHDLERALSIGASLIGVNHRDLETFEVDPERTAKLAPRVPDSVTLVGLSGVSTRSDVVALGAAGAGAVLVGEALVRSSDPAAKLRELRGVA